MALSQAQAQRRWEEMYMGSDTDDDTLATQRSATKGVAPHAAPAPATEAFEQDDFLARLREQR